MSRILAAALCVAACDAAHDQELGGKAPFEPVVVEAAEPAPEVSEPTFCDLEMARVLAEPPLPGAPAFDGRRAEILARAKAHPILFVEAPRAERSPRAEALRRRIEEADVPAYALYDLYPSLTRYHALAREVLLTDGYLYAESPGLAVALARVVRLHHLFDDREIWIHRGERILKAERRKGTYGRYYVYADGPRAGRTAHLLFGDRVAASREKLQRPLHRDVTHVARRLGFDRMAVRHLTAEAIVADVRYGETWVSTVLRSQGAKTELYCETVPQREAQRVQWVREQAGRREAALARLRDVIEQQIDEGLPFDEPKTEYGQQDGKLRQHWYWAYRYGETRFEFNEDEYRVFDYEGRPRVPQVCIDFITDTFERASGSWYRPRGEKREWRRGRLDFDEFGMENGRSVESFVDFTRTRPQWFEVYDLPEQEQIPLARRAEFFGYLLSHAERFRPGDIVVIYGLRDDDKMHYHSFIVYDTDPITGMPIQVAANAGKPRIRTWDGEMSNAPRRTIRTRIRPRLDWLVDMVTAESETARREASAEAPMPI